MNKKGISMIIYGDVMPEWSKVSLCGLVKLKVGESEPDYHFHDCDEYFIVTEGRGMVLLEGVECEMSSGDVVCIPLGGKHLISKVLEELHLVFVYFEPRGLRRFGHIPAVGDEPLVEGCKIFKSWEWLELKPAWSRLASLGVLRYQFGAIEMDYHYHDCDEYYFVAKGSFHIIVEGEEIELACGDIYPIRLGERHRVLEAKEDATLVFIQDQLEGLKRYGHLDT